MKQCGGPCLGHWGTHCPGVNNHVRLYPSQGNFGADEAEPEEAASVWGPEGQTRALTLALSFSCCVTLDDG